EWKKGEKEDGSDCEAFQIAPHSHWNLHCVILVIQEHEKLVSSTEGMKHAEKTSPYFLKWSEEAEKDYLEIKKFVLEKDFEMLSKTVEANCLKMHKTCLTSIPPTLYWSGKTLEILDKIRDWQRGGLRAFFTIDAGPNVVIFCEESSKDSLFELASKLPYVSPLLTKIGTGPVYF
ncbi:MAG: diphosphomevalonate decarboxylase, partial [Deltaproteobacteria bacterium]|nr:diphosphomevalonate decarboxylase [Deltaproteobacteria bacterium]